MRGRQRRQGAPQRGRALRAQRLVAQAASSHQGQPQERRDADRIGGDELCAKPLDLAPLLADYT